MTAQPAHPLGRISSASLSPSTAAVTFPYAASRASRLAARSTLPTSLTGRSCQISSNLHTKYRTPNIAGQISRAKYRGPNIAG